MNIGVVLNYFHYFLHFPSYDISSSYSFITSRRTYTSQHIASLQYVNWKDYLHTSSKPTGNVDALFAMSIKLRLLPPQVDCNQLCSFYERKFEKFLEKQRIDLLISGGVSGFERVGLETARRMGIKTLCIWEGMFRPYTISADPMGMNMEASIARKPFMQILNHSGTEAFEVLWNKVAGMRQVLNLSQRKLTAVLGDRFRIGKQLKNRMDDRYDIERIRISWSQLAKARLSYYGNKSDYLSINGVTSPFLFFPLQTHTDSNMVLNAPLESMDDYLKVVLSAFSEFHKRSGINLIIKEHPMDLFRKSYKKKQIAGVYWIHPATSIDSLLDHSLCRGTIVVNSTAGIESLIAHKPVLCLGNALYGYPELVEMPDAITPLALCNSLENLVDRKMNDSFTKQFCNFLYDTIQMNGNLDTVPNVHEIKHCCSIFQSHCR